MTDNPILFDKAPRPRTTILEDLLAVDGRLLSQLGRRMKLMQRAAKGRQVLDRELEKELWSSFDKAARAQGLDPRLTRQLFALLGSFGLEQAAKRRSADKPFTLVPRSEAADIDITGPRSRAHTRMLAVLAAATGQGLRLSGVVLSDPLIELVKALNQCGAHLSWSEDTLEAAKSEKTADEFPLRFEDLLVFAGEDPFTLYVLIAFALREAGRSKFAGGAGLKGMDLRALDVILPALGARLAPMNPRTRGLPARLESGGRMATRVELAADTPVQFAQALALAAFSYPEGLRLALPADPRAAAKLAEGLEEVVGVLSMCDLKARRSGEEFVIPAGRPRLAKLGPMPLDPALSAYVLGIAAVAGGSVRLGGHLTLPKAVQDDFAALGLSPEIDNITAECKGAPLTAGQNLSMGRDPRYLPLALALALKAGGARIALPGDAASRVWAVDLMDRLGAGMELGDDAQADQELIVTSGPTAAWDGVWTSPDAWCTLGLALMSFVRPGIALDNPGGLAGLWPRFWALYNSLPIARDLPPAPKAPEKTEQKPKGRRVKVHE